VNIFHTELNARSHSFFSWWTPAEPLLEDRTSDVDVLTPMLDTAQR
jgi:hypothetical protein